MKRQHKIAQGFSPGLPRALALGWPNPRSAPKAFPTSRSRGAIRTRHFWRTASRVAPEGIGAGICPAGAANHPSVAAFRAIFRVGRTQG